MRQSKQRWTKQEDDALRRAVTKDDHRWSEVAIRFAAILAQQSTSNNLPTRTSKQCRERWNNHVRPDLKKSAWTEAEDLKLIDLFKKCGNKFTIIGEALGRADIHVRNRIHSTRRMVTKHKAGFATTNSRKDGVLFQYFLGLDTAAKNNNPTHNTTVFPDVTKPRKTAVYPTTVFPDVTKPRNTTVYPTTVFPDVSKRTTTFPFTNSTNTMFPTPTKEELARQERKRSSLEVILGLDLDLQNEFRNFDVPADVDMAKQEKKRSSLEIIVGQDLIQYDFISSLLDTSDVSNNNISTTTTTTQSRPTPLFIVDQWTPEDSGFDFLKAESPRFDAGTNLLLSPESSKILKADVWSGSAPTWTDSYDSNFSVPFPSSCGQSSIVNGGDCTQFLSYAH